MIKLPDLSALKAVVKRTLRPRTKWGRVALWSSGLSVLLYALGWLRSFGSSMKPGGWTEFFALIFAFSALRLVTPWVWRRVMWRLRYRLMVTYLFIGVIPIVLLLTMAGVGGYLFAGQFATYAAISNLQAALQFLETPNDALAAQLAAMNRSGKQINKLPENFSTCRA